MSTNTGYELKHWGIKGMVWDKKKNTGSLPNSAERKENIRKALHPSNQAPGYVPPKVGTADYRRNKLLYDRELAKQKKEKADQATIDREPALKKFNSRTIVDVVNDKKKKLNSNEAGYQDYMKRNKQTGEIPGTRAHRMATQKLGDYAVSNNEGEMKRRGFTKTKNGTLVKDMAPNEPKKKPLTLGKKILSYFMKKKK